MIYFLIFVLFSENGYTFIKLHIDGKDFKNCTSRYLSQLRSQLCKVLMCPPEAILFNGVEPSSSLLVTVMIPDLYADILLEMLNEGYEFPELEIVGVDTVKIRESTFSIIGE